MRNALDHIAVVAPSLAVGAALVRAKLGVEMQPGGVHRRMGTHNLLLSLGDSAYLEVIAMDPAAPHPGRARWFELDRLQASDPARLACWVVRTADIASAVAQCPLDLGRIEAMSRGALNWQITVPDDGRLPMDGAAPTLIQWHTQNHPASTLPKSGCTLMALEIFHPEPPQVMTVLERLDLESVPRVSTSARGPASLVAHILTPGGLRSL